MSDQYGAGKDANPFLESKFITCTHVKNQNGETLYLLSF
jgi:hypothetical protein